MKIRYLKIQNYPPIQDIAIAFPGMSLLEDRLCSIKFVVGVNGSGKSHLLRAIYQIFLSLSRSEFPPFPVVIIYELKGHENTSIVFYQQMSQVYWWLVPETFPTYKEEDWNELVEDLLSKKKNANLIMNGTDFPNVIPFLPKAVLAYSTGLLYPWENFLSPITENIDFSELGINKEYTDNIQIKPFGWNKEKEKLFLWNNEKEKLFEWSEYQKKKFQLSEEKEILFPTIKLNDFAVIQAIEKLEKEILEQHQIDYVCNFLTPKYLKFGFLAALLFYFVIKKSDDPDTKEFLTLIEEQSGFKKVISFSWKINLDLGKLKLYNRLFQVEKLFESASEILKEANPSEMRTLFFDLDDIGDNSFKENIINVFGQNDNSFEFLKRLIEFEEQGILEDVEIILKKKDLDGIILFSELSDGEQMFLCRMSLFHLLKDYDDALLILDEPETHFNDKWKREIVDMIDSALKDTASEVLISTHSSIVLTDVFHDEIVLLDKEVDGTKRIEIVSPTFGAITSEILTKVFSFHRKEKIFELSEKDFGKDNSVDRNDKITIGRRAYNYLKKQLNDRKWSYENIEELEHIVNNIGIGYYQNRLSSILYKLKEEKNASSD